MIYELFLEGQLADIRQDLGVQLNFNIDDISKYGSRDTSFSKTIVLPGTARNNKLFGFVSELGSFNSYASESANINDNFNPAQTTKAELRANGLLLLKGVFRLTGIIKDRDFIEYEGNLFGELGGFIAAIGNAKLENLDFKIYNHTYNVANITNSWDGRVTKQLILNFAFGGSNTIFVAARVDLKLKPNDQIKITNAAVPANNKTYTVVTYAIINQFPIITTVESMTLSLADIVDVEYPLEAGTGFYYPLIDHGTYSTPEIHGDRAKIDYDIRTFRPALHVWEYMDKIFNDAGFTYQSNFFETDFFKKLIIPSTNMEAQGFFSDLFLVRDSDRINLQTTNAPITLIYNFSNESVVLNRSFTGTGDPNITYTGTPANVVLKISARVRLENLFIFSYRAVLRVEVNGVTVLSDRLPISIEDRGYSVNLETNISLNTNDTIAVLLDYENTTDSSSLRVTEFSINSIVPILTAASPGDEIYIKDQIPKNIFQKDFFSWILKMFNLYVTEDKLRSNHLIIEPYKDYYNLNDIVDLTYKVARDKPWQIKPMGMLNGRLFEYKYKDDNDYYNEKYKKKYNIPYGSNLFDSGFQFAKSKQTIEVGFSPTVLVQYQGTDKIVPAIYKQSNGNSVQQEEKIPYNIRILLRKKMNSFPWVIYDRFTNISTFLFSYGYAGHFDDPVNPTIDINFGASAEIYFDPVTYPTNNLFNTYWSSYIAEIADKDSKLLTCHVYLTDLDIAQLDFSKPVFIDGVLWRINKIIDFDASSGELTKVELLKVINNG